MMDSQNIFSIAKITTIKKAWKMSSFKFLFKTKFNQMSASDPTSASESFSMKTLATKRNKR